MTKPIGDWARAMAHRIGLSGEIKFTRARVGQTLHIPCKRGDHIVDVSVAANQHPDAIAKKLLNEGWTIGSHPTCPEHSRKAIRKRAAQVERENVEVAIEDVTPSAAIKNHASSKAMMAAAGAPTQITDAMRRAHRMMVMALDDYYDTDGKRYKPGWNDARIAKESGASEAHVSEHREMWYGPLGEPAELTALRTDMAKAIERFDSIALDTKKVMDDIGKISTRFERLCSKMGWPVV